MLHTACMYPAVHPLHALQQLRNGTAGAARRGCWILCSLPHLRSRLVRVLRGVPESTRPVRAAYAVPLSTITHDDGRLRSWPWTRAAPRWRSSARTCRMRRRRWRPPVPSRAPPAAPIAPPLPLPPACWTRRSGSCECSMGLAGPNTQANAPARRHAAAAADRRRARLPHVPPEAARGPPPRRPALAPPLPPASQLGNAPSQPATCGCHRRGTEGSVRLPQPISCDAASAVAPCRPCRPARRCAELGPRGPSCATSVVVLSRRVVARLLGAHRAASRPVEADRRSHGFFRGLKFKRQAPRLERRARRHLRRGRPTGRMHRGSALARR